MDENNMNAGGAQPPCVSTPGLWSILPDALSRWNYEYESYVKGPPDYRAYIEAKGPFDFDPSTADARYWLDGDIAVLSIEGVILPKGDFWTALFAGVAPLDILTRDYKALMARDDVNAIVLDIDSPGGSVFGMFSFANMIFEARMVKPVYSISGTMMTSAAALIGAAASESAITDQAVVTGSLAVMTEHTDISRMLEMAGVKKRVITSGQRKTIASPYAPLDDKGEAELQAQVDHTDRVLIETVAKFRNMSIEDVREKMPEGRLFMGSEAIEANLIDGMLPSEEFMRRVKAEIMSVNFNRN
jgi:signal peptide peptidase SppA